MLYYIFTSLFAIVYCIRSDDIGEYGSRVRRWKCHHSLSVIERTLKHTSLATVNALSCTVEDYCRHCLVQGIVFLSYS